MDDATWFTALSRTGITVIDALDAVMLGFGALIVGLAETLGLDRRVLGLALFTLVLVALYLPLGIKRFVGLIDGMNEWVGRTVAWLTLLMVSVTFFVAIARYGFAFGKVWLQESYVWMHGAVFMLGAGYTLLHNGHVRVDVFYRPASVRYKAWIDLLGVVLLLTPMIAFVYWYAVPYVASSWRALEASREAGGLPRLYWLKTALLLFCLFTFLQGLSLALRSAMVLRGHPDFRPEDERLGEV